MNRPPLVSAQAWRAAWEQAAILVIVEGHSREKRTDERGRRPNAKQADGERRTVPRLSGQMLERGASCDVSARFFAIYVGGYAISLLYGLTIDRFPVIVVHAVGLLFGAVTLGIARSLRGSLLDPASWSGCRPADRSLEWRGR